MAFTFYLPHETLGFDRTPTLEALEIWLIHMHESEPGPRPGPQTLVPQRLAPGDLPQCQGALGFTPDWRPVDSS